MESTDTPATFRSTVLGQHVQAVTEALIRLVNRWDPLPRCAIGDPLVAALGHLTGAMEGAYRYGTLAHLNGAYHRAGDAADEAQALLQDAARRGLVEAPLAARLDRELHQVKVVLRTMAIESGRVLTEWHDNNPESPTRAETACAVTAAIPRLK